MIFHKSSYGSRPKPNLLTKKKTPHFNFDCYRRNVLKTFYAILRLILSSNSDS